MIELDREADPALRREDRSTAVWLTALCGLALVGAFALLCLLARLAAERTPAPIVPAGGPSYNTDPVDKVIDPTMTKVVIAGMPDALTWCVGGTRYFGQAPYGADTIEVLDATADRTCTTEANP